MTKSKVVRKAVFPVAGLGTRFLPATKAMPKEMLPVVDKPLIQYAVEEAAGAGIRDMIFITGRNKRAIEDHFDRAYELETELELKNKQDVLDELRDALPSNINCIFLRQGDALGLGHAVLCAEPVIGDEPFAVILADDLLRPPQGKGDEAGATAQLCRAYAESCNAAGAVIGVKHIEGDAISRYGAIKIAEGFSAHDKVMKLSGIVEKPKPSEAPSQFGAIGRYVLPASIFGYLKNIGKGSGGEIQLTDGIAALMRQETVFAIEMEGVRYDCGTKLGFLEATVRLALEREEFGEDFVKILRGVLG